MNAIDLLLNEHNKVRKLLTDIADASHRFETKQKIFDELADNLLRHEQMEETVWYPQLKNEKNLYDEIKHLIKEEKSAEKAIQKLKSEDSQEKWEATFKKFKEDVEHHAKEEEKDLFPKVQKILDEETLKRIGKEMLEFKREYES